MRIQVRHLTRYSYTQPVLLDPHTIRLRPRQDSYLALEQYSLHLDPVPMQQSWVLDPYGNNVLRAWFEQPTDHLTLEVNATVSTLRTNPFDFLLPAWGLKLPIDEPTSIRQGLAPYLVSSPWDQGVALLAQDCWIKAAGDPVQFVGILNQTIWEQCDYSQREQGDPWPAGYTWAQRAGSCRDLTVLVMACCRVVGLAARFVSGYQMDPPDLAQVQTQSQPTQSSVTQSQMTQSQTAQSQATQTQAMGSSNPGSSPDAAFGWSQRHLHAWAEIYLPGGGWRGYDPTQGLAVADQHIPLAASPTPSGTAPVSGGWRGSEAQLTLGSELWMCWL